VQGSRQILRAIEQLKPDPPLLPADPAQRARVEEAESWGEQELQNAPRVLLRWGLVHDSELREWLARASGLPLPSLSARTSVPVARYYAHSIGANEQAARRVLGELPAMLDRADALLADGTLTSDPPNAATFQILCSVRALDAFTDLQGLLSARPSTVAAHELFPQYPGPVPPFLPAGWLAELEPAGVS
jgi:glutathione S-transferase